MYKYLYIAILLLSFSAPNLVAQEKPDTSIVIRSFRLDPLTMDLEKTEIDTSFDAVYYYNPLNRNNNFSNTFLGNSGQAAITNDFSKRNNNNPFLFAIPYQMYLSKPADILHFNTRKPYSELKYLSSGTKEDSEQILSALHTQNVNQYLNIGLFYDLIASKGMYPDQNVSTNRINLFGSYKKSNYEFVTSLHYNGIKAQENGGLLDLDEFIEQQNDALNFSMQLDDANARFKNLDVFFTQKLNLAALSEDSARSEHLNNFAVHHTLNYNRYVKTYTDVISPLDTINYYADNHYLINEAFDSAFYQNLTNRIDLSLKLANESQELRLYLKHELKTFSFLKPVGATYISDSVSVDSIIREPDRTLYNDISVGGQYIGRLKTWNYTLNGQLFLTGYNIGDLYINGHFIKYFSEKQRYVKLSGELSSLKPSFFLQKYSSAHFIWNNDFTKIETTKAGLEYSGFQDFTANIDISLINDYVYLNTEAIPVQFNGQLLVITGKADKIFDMGHFKSRNSVMYQVSSSDIVRLPMLSYKNVSWFETEVFRGALSFQIGAELYYFTEYYGDAYMAATGQFYNQDVEKIGNYPFVTGFLNAKIARTRFTLQYTNALGGLLTPAYFMAYRYPCFNETLKFGIAWTFYD